MDWNTIKLIGTNIFAPSLYDDYESMCNSWIEGEYLVLDWEYKYNIDGFIQCRIHLDNGIHVIFSASYEAIVTGIEKAKLDIPVIQIDESANLDEYDTGKMVILVMNDPMSDDLYDNYDSINIDKFLSIINDERITIDRWE